MYLRPISVMRVRAVDGSVAIVAFHVLLTHTSFLALREKGSIGFVVQVCGAYVRFVVQKIKNMQT